MSMTRFVGVDEAGYGPNLGPLVVAAVALRAPADWRNRDWWDALSPIVSRSIESPYPIDDSKRLFSSPTGRLALRRTVASLVADLPSSVRFITDVLDCWARAGSSEWRQEHWFDPEQRSPFVDGESFNTRCRSRGVTVDDVRVDVIFPRRFNQRLADLGNKAQVETESVRLVLGDFLNPSMENPTACHVTVDRLGGRKFYRELAEDLAGDAFVATHEESAEQSTYRWVGQTEVQLSFVARADALYMPVALASMIAKFLREEAMTAFNAFWTHRIPGLHPTAGYPVDARRFWKEIGPWVQKEHMSKSAIWREK